MFNLICLKKFNCLKKNNSNKYLNEGIIRHFSRVSDSNTIINYFENITIRQSVAFTYHYRGRKFFGNTRPLDKDANFVLLNKHRLQMAGVKLLTKGSKFIKMRKNKLSLFWLKLVQYDPTFFYLKNFYKSANLKFSYLKSIKCNADRVRFINYFSHPVLVSEYSGLVVSLYKNSSKIDKNFSYKYFNIPVLCNINPENSVRLPWFTRLPFSSILLVVIPESLTFYFISVGNWLNFIKFDFIKLSNNFNWLFESKSLANLGYSKSNKNYFINLDLGFKRTHIINPLFSSVDIGFSFDSLFENSVPFNNNSFLLELKSDLAPKESFKNNLTGLNLLKQPIKESSFMTLVRRRFILTAIVLKLSKVLCLSKYKLCLKYNQIFFNIMKIGWNLLLKNLQLKILSPMHNLKFFSQRVAKTFAKFWLTLNTPIEKSNTKHLLFFSLKFAGLKKRAINLSVIYKSKYINNKLFRKLMRKRFNSFEWKFFDRKWYFKYSRWKYSVLFKVLIKEAWNNFRKINKNFLFVKFFKVHVFNILGLKDWDLWCLWKQIRFGNNVNYNISVMQRFNIFLQLKLDSLVLLLNIMPNRPLAQEFVKFGSLRINGSVETNFNKSLALNDILQVELASAVKIKKLYSKVGRFYKDQSKHYNIQEVIKALPFLQILNSFLLIMLVRYPSKYEMVSESILSDRWIRFYVRYFPVKMAKYFKPKVKWFKY